jgi:O-antigen ligase
MVISVLFYAFVKLQASNINIGTSLKDYIFVLALSPFFYGAVVYSKYSKNDFDWERIFDALIIVGVLNISFSIIKPFFEISRLFFLIIPFLFTYIFINFSDTSQLKKIIYSGLVLLYYLGTDGITFTLIFSAFISTLLIRRKVKSTIVPFVLVLLVVYIPIYAINNSDQLDFTDFIDLDMSDIRTLDDFNGRLGMKLIEDRGPIWTSAWDYLKENISILPPLDKYKLFVKSKLNSETEWEFHSHNLALESLLNLGLILGILVLIFFLYINFTSVKGLNYQRLKPIAKIFIIVTVVSNIVGSMSGIFPLLLDYAFLPLVIMGAYYYNKKTII